MLTHHYYTWLEPMLGVALAGGALMLAVGIVDILTGGRLLRTRWGLAGLWCALGVVAIGCGAALCAIIDLVLTGTGIWV